MTWHDKRVLITGLSGFVGSHLGEYLVTQGAEVYGLVRARADGGIPRHIADHYLDKSAHLLSADLLDPSSISDALDESQPDVLFHLAAQTSATRSFQLPGETHAVNSTGTFNLLESVRLRGDFPVFVFAGSSEEYGLVFGSEGQYEDFKAAHGPVFPEPVSIPELPVAETNPLRPISPYGVAKVHGDYMTRNYAMTWGIPAVVSRAFNHEGAGRGDAYVTSSIARQVARIARGQQDGRVVVGNVNSFKDWSHVSDIVRGYCVLAESGVPGGIYNLGSQRSNSVLSYLMFAIEETGVKVDRIETFRGGKVVEGPMEPDDGPMWGCAFDKTRVDALMLNGELSFDPADEGIWVHTDGGKIPVHFDPDRFRPLEVPILIADTSKARQLGFRVEHSVADIARDQVRSYLGEAIRETETRAPEVHP